MDNKKTFNGKILAISVTAVVLLGLGLVLLGYLAITWKQPQQQVVLVTRVCDDSFVERFNKIEEDGFKTLAADVKSKDGYSSDPTCQTILLVAALQERNYKDAKQAYDAVIELHSQHVYVDSNLNTGASLDDFEAAVKDLSSQNQGSAAEDQKGGA